MLKTKNLYKTFNQGKEQQAILKNINLEIEENQLVALMGPSGSGKSTLLAILAGIDSPSEGQIYINNTEVSQMKEKELAQIRNRDIGIVFQSFNLLPGLTAMQNVEAPLYISKNKQNIPGRAKEMLEKVGLGDKLNHKPHQLSGGQKQRVGIARALVGRTKILVADEPTGNLDSTSGQNILQLIQEIRREFGLTVLIATHDEKVAGKADRIIQIRDGYLFEEVN
jgi:putative ABC transport system ATP-binding protein